MRVVSHVIAFAALVSVFLGCKKDGYPVPPASTVPKFSYTLDNNGYAPATAVFANESIVPDNVGDAYYSWQFGDGGTSAEADPTHLYSAPGTYTVKLTIKTSVSQEIVSKTQEIQILSTDVSGIEVYFTDGSIVYKGYLNDATPVFSALPIGPFDDSYGMAIDTTNSKLYISDAGAGKIYRYDLATGALIEFRTGLAGPDGLAIDFNTGKLYWDTDNGIQRTDLTTLTVSDKEDFVTGESNDPEGVSIDAVNNKLYWINYDGGLYSISLSGGSKTELVADAEGGSTLVVGGKVYFDYYVASGDIYIKSANLDGSGVGTISTGNSRVVFGIGYESWSNKIYWGDRGAGKIKRANLDGSGVETWYSKDGSSPRAIVFGKKKE
ncbi:MAG: PKD domain-containing protein [Breznakibacter sp.]